MSTPKGKTAAAPVAPDETPERTRALIDVPVLALGAPGTIAVLGDDGAWRAVAV